MGSVVAELVLTSAQSTASDGSRRKNRAAEDLIKSFGIIAAPQVKLINRRQVAALL